MWGKMAGAGVVVFMSITSSIFEWLISRKPVLVVFFCLFRFKKKIVIREEDQTYREK